MVQKGEICPLADEIKTALNHRAGVSDSRRITPTRESDGKQVVTGLGCGGRLSLGPRLTSVK